MAEQDDGFLSLAERSFLRELDAHGVRYLVVGMSAALLQGARGATDDIDLWFENIGDPRIGDAAREAGGFWVTRTQPPMLGGALGERFDVVMTMSGLPDFSAEYAAAKTAMASGVQLRLLPLRRILHSKQTAGRDKDKAVLYALESAIKLLDELGEA